MVLKPLYNYKYLLIVEIRLAAAKRTQSSDLHSRAKGGTPWRIAAALRQTSFRWNCNRNANAANGY